MRRNRNNNGYYTPCKADSGTRSWRRRSRRNARITPEQYAIVERSLGMDWSPEQVSGFLRVEGLMRITHETIYVHIWHHKAQGGDLWKHLRQATKKYRKRYRGYDSRGKLAGKCRISERPPEMENRAELGHWEIDTVKGDSQTLHSVVNIVKRATGYLQIGKLERHRAVDTTNRCIELIERRPGSFTTITADNGTEFQSYSDIEAATGVEFYFATPHHSWERGTNENTNGLIRQYLPKRTSYKTPEECYAETG